MGFFSDLKEDLSQAVNELMPDGETAAAEGAEAEKTKLEETKAEETETEGAKEEGKTQETKEQEQETSDAISLDEMLENIDLYQFPEEPGEEAESEPVKEEERPEFFTGPDTEIVSEKASEEDPGAADAEEEESPQESAAGGTQEDWDLDSMLKNALTDEQFGAADKTEEYKGEGKTMEMFTTREAADETSLITAGMTITGDLVSEGSLDIMGKVNGNIDVIGKLNITGHVNGNSKAAEIYAEGAKINGEVVSEGAVKIGASTVIVGNITATSAAIAGAVKGDIDVKGPVVLDTTAIVMGNIKSKSVQINNGAAIEGMCSQCYADVSPTSFFEDYKMETKKDKATK